MSIFKDQPMGCIDVLDGDPFCDASSEKQGKSKTWNERDGLGERREIIDCDVCLPLVVSRCR